MDGTWGGWIPEPTDEEILAQENLNLQSELATAHARIAELEDASVFIEASVHALKATKIRIAFIGWPNEPRNCDGNPDWRYEIKVIDSALEKLPDCYSYPDSVPEGDKE